MMEHLIGRKKNTINTPALLIDLVKMEDNIRYIANYFRDKDANLRPHTKTHKTPILAHRQIESGAVGITCAKLAEAEIMAGAGIKDILVANQIVGVDKITRLADLAKYVDMKVAVDSIDNILMLSKSAEKKGVKIGVLVEVNVGMDRCGVEPGEPVFRLTQQIEKQRGLKFLGLMGYEGHAVMIQEYEKRKEEAERSMRLLINSKKLLEQRGIQVKIVSAGGTGTYNITGCYPGVTEVQAGSYILMDTKYRTIVKEFKLALTLLTTVISRPKANIAMIDAGKKSITHEFGMPEVAYPKKAKLVTLTEEHGKIELEGCDHKPLIGEKIELIPSHGCTTINLHDYSFGIRDDVIESVYRIEARGKFG